jgi:enamine deaminase RidA (YjgF/YER057c/UK114 family)
MIAPAGRTVYVGGQNGVDSSGTLLEGLGAQTERALRNVLALLDAAGTDAEHVAKLTIYLGVGIDPTDAYSATRTVWGDRRTAVSALAVDPAKPGALGLARFNSNLAPPWETLTEQLAGALPVQVPRDLPQVTFGVDGITGIDAEGGACAPGR